MAGLAETGLAALGSTMTRSRRSFMGIANGSRRLKGHIRPMGEVTNANLQPKPYR